MSRVSRSALSAGLGIVALIAFAAWRTSASGRTSSRAPARVVASDAGVNPAAYSNIHAADYVGPRACGECHARNYDRWQHSLHAAMNQRAEGVAVVGDFADARLDYAGGTARFERDGDAYVMTFGAAAGPTRRYRVTRTIGSRYLQEYVGVPMDGGDAEPTEIRLPFGYWLRARAWFPQPYFDSWYGAEYDAAGALAVDVFQPDPTPWASRCAWCHNTYPFELRALRTLRHPPLGEGTEQYFDYAPAGGLAAHAPVLEANLLPVDALVTVGISCESCHLGGREHAVAGREIRFVPTGPELEPRADAPSLAGGRQNSVLVVTICAQCHSTPTPRFPDGAGQRNSSEALDLAAGACMARIKCTDCHDPHQAGAGAGAPDQARHVAACVGCHDFLASPRAARAHSRHLAASASCLDCHMPKIVQGVSDHVRSHRISSPGDARMLAAGAPDACNLCHLDRSPAWTVGALAAGWGRRVPLARPASATPAGELWLHSDEPAYRAVAAAAYARLPRALAHAALPALVAVLDDPIAYYRMRVLFAIEDILGRRVRRDEYDPLAAPAVRAQQAQRLRSAWGDSPRR